MFHHRVKMTLFPLMHLSIILSLVQAPTLRAQSDLDLIQAIAAKDIQKVSICMKRQINPNRLYGGKTSLMIAIEQFGESLTNNAKQQDEATLLKNAWQFISGAGLFTGGLGVTGIAGLSFWDLKNEREQNDAQGSGVQQPEAQQSVDTQQPVADPTETSPRSSSSEGSLQPQSWLANLREKAFSTISGFSVPSDEILEFSDIDAELPGTGMGDAALSHQTGLNYVLPRKTIREVHHGVIDIRNGVQDIRLVVKIITIAALIGSSAAGVIAMTRGVPRSINGLFNTVTKPFQILSHKQELKKLKKIIYLLLQQEQIDVDAKGENGESAFDIIERLMLQHIDNKDEYQKLAEIEQLIKVRQIVS